MSGRPLATTSVDEVLAAYALPDDQEAALLARYPRLAHSLRAVRAARAASSLDSHDFRNSVRIVRTTPHPHPHPPHASPARTSARSPGRESAVPGAPAGGRSVVLPPSMTGSRVPDATGWSPPKQRKGVWEALYEKYVQEDLAASTVLAVRDEGVRKVDVGVDTAELSSDTTPVLQSPGPGPDGMLFEVRTRPKDGMRAGVSDQGDLLIEDLDVGTAPPPTSKRPTSATMSRPASATTRRAAPATRRTASATTRRTAPATRTASSRTASSRTASTTRPATTRPPASTHATTRPKTAGSLTSRKRKHGRTVVPRPKRRQRRTSLQSKSTTRARRKRTKSRKSTSNSDDTLANFIAATQLRYQRENKERKQPTPSSLPVQEEEKKEEKKEEEEELTTADALAAEAVAKMRERSLSPSVRGQLSFLSRVTNLSSIQEETQSSPAAAAATAAAAAAARYRGGGGGGSPPPLPVTVAPRRISALLGSQRRKPRRMSMFEVGTPERVSNSMKQMKKRMKKGGSGKGSGRSSRGGHRKRRKRSNSRKHSMSSEDDSDDDDDHRHGTRSSMAGTLFGTSVGTRSRSHAGHRASSPIRFSPIPQLPEKYLQRQHDEAALFFEIQRKKKAEEERKTAYQRSMSARIRFEKERKARLKAERTAKRAARMEREFRERLAHATTAAIAVELHASVTVRAEARERRRKADFRDTLSEWCQNHATRVHRNLVRAALHREQETRHAERRARSEAHEKKRDRVLEKKRAEAAALREIEVARKKAEAAAALAAQRAAEYHAQVLALRRAVFLQLEERAIERRARERAQAEADAEASAFESFLARQAVAAARRERLHANLQKNPDLETVEWGIPPTQDEMLDAVLDKIVTTSLLQRRSVGA